MNERSWSRLLTDIHTGNVIPVIGPQILHNDQGIYFYAAVARELLHSYQDLEISPSALVVGNEISSAISLIRNADKNIKENQLYGDVTDAIEKVTKGDFSISPPAIRHLAEIADFRLIVYLCPDTLLKTALLRRIAVREIVHAPSLPDDQLVDLAKGWQGMVGEVNLCYLFGNATLGHFATHDEDILEFAYNLIEGGTGRPKDFLDAMRPRKLLLIGCGFTDWLARFFLRLINSERLRKKEVLEWYVEDLSQQKELTLFLNTYSKETVVVDDVSPMEFVAELHRRWQEKYALGSELIVNRDDLPFAHLPPRPVFFISYSRQTDAATAASLYAQLRELGAAENEIWFDRKVIEPGDDFKHLILEGIKGCRFFIPIISAAADQRSQGFFRREWDYAADLLAEHAPNEKFILPLIIDAEYQPENYCSLPQKWSSRDFMHAPAGNLETRAHQVLRDCLRKARKTS